MYEGESNENLKYFFTCDLLNKSGTQMYHFSTVSLTFNTLSPAHRKCMDSSGKKFLWSCAQPLVHHLVHLFIGMKFLSSHRLLSGPNMW
jgi:hypothetical protein